MSPEPPTSHGVTRSQQWVGRILGKYRIAEKIGSGTMADVYRGIQIGLDRDVAIKILAPALAADGPMAARFRKIAQVTARLSHPNIITIFDSGEQDGIQYFVMEYLRSGTLEDRIEREHPFGLPRVLKIMQDVLKALAYAHEKGICHRSLTASAVKFDSRDNAIVTDFRAVEEGSGNPVEDLVAAARMLHALLTGNLLAELGEKRHTVPVSKLDPDLPEELVDFVERALAAGFANAREMLVALKGIELKLRLQRHGRVTYKLQLPAVSAEPPVVYASDSSDSFGILSSLSEIVSRPEERRAVARAFSLALPLFLLALIGAVWVAREVSSLLRPLFG